MKQNVPVSLAVAIIAVIWVYLCMMLDIPSWTAFVGWSVYFYGGANFESIKVGAPSLILGGLLAYLAVYIQGGMGSIVIVQMIPIFFMAFFMTMAQSFEMFKSAPAIFLGGALYFATGDLFTGIILALVGLIVLGLASTFLTQFIEGKMQEPPTDEIMG